MYFVYTPEGMPEPKLRVPFEPGKMLNAEAEQIEKRTGMTFPEWVEAVHNSSMTALHALIWVLLKRTEPTLRWDQVAFTADECDFDMDDDEFDQLIANLRKKAAEGGLTDAQAQFLDEVEAKRKADGEPEPVVDEVPAPDPTPSSSDEEPIPAT